eukprot:TRINITY_DN2048_c0_g1_i1.p1 TRINITY_DN2048_c0_g1~~TRINITY_DN2048_c0_g1_i1.p1  ORF type:complete len:896 (-),score=188.53 TRINITY_DN2048_c0_g1_i1:165-2720(-)
MSELDTVAPVPLTSPSSTVPPQHQQEEGEQEHEEAVVVMEERKKHQQQKEGGEEQEEQKEVELESPYALVADFLRSQSLHELAALFENSTVSLHKKQKKKSATGTGLVEESSRSRLEELLILGQLSEVRGGTVSPSSLLSTTLRVNRPAQGKSGSLSKSHSLTAINAPIVGDPFSADRAPFPSSSLTKSAGSHTFGSTVEVETEQYKSFKLTREKDMYGRQLAEVPLDATYDTGPRSISRNSSVASRKLSQSSSSLVDGAEMRAISRHSRDERGSGHYTLASLTSPAQGLATDGKVIHDGDSLTRMGEEDSQKRQQNQPSPRTTMMMDLSSESDSEFSDSSADMISLEDSEDEGGMVSLDGGSVTSAFLTLDLESSSNSPAASPAPPSNASPAPSSASSTSVSISTSSDSTSVTNAATSSASSASPSSTSATQKHAHTSPSPPPLKPTSPRLDSLREAGRGTLSSSNSSISSMCSSESNVTSPGRAMSRASELDYSDQNIITGTDGDLRYLNLKVIHRPKHTGFEDSRDFPVRMHDIIAGRYEVAQYLGSAAFSKALQCLDHKTGQMVCLKVVKNNKDFFDQCLDEVKLLQYLRDNGDADDLNFVKMLDYFYYKEHLFIVCELLRENLYEFYKLNRQSGGAIYFTYSNLQKVAMQTLVSLEYIHSLGLIHCDLKPENILMRSYGNCKIKVIDFGSSCYTHDTLSSYVQSRSYRAVEVILGLPYSHPIDLWSLGCILAELHSGKVLFQNDSVATLLARVHGTIGPVPSALIKRGRYAHKYYTDDYRLFEANKKGAIQLLQTPKTSLSTRIGSQDELFLDFLRQLLSIDPAQRPTATEAMQHPFLLHNYSQEK